MLWGSRTGRSASLEYILRPRLVPSRLGSRPLVAPIPADWINKRIVQISCGKDTGRSCHQAGGGGHNPSPGRAVFVGGPCP